jgi:hypothetical protein
MVLGLQSIVHAKLQGFFWLAGMQVVGWQHSAGAQSESVTHSFAVFPSVGGILLSKGCVLAQPNKKSDIIISIAICQNFK